MLKYIFVGDVLPDSVRINSATIRIQIEAKDCPAGHVETRIVDNKIVAVALVEDELTPVAKATLFNVINDVADSICSTGLLVEGLWAVANVDTCIGPDNLVDRRIVSSAPELKEQFSELGINAARLEDIYGHKDGFHLRLAVEDILAAIRKQKFMRAYFYRATESLLQSVSIKCEISDNPERKWNNFWGQLSLDRGDFRIYIENHDERHANYAQLKPLTAAEKAKVYETMAKILVKYIEWFEKTEKNER